MSEPLKLCTFVLDGHHFGVDVRVVQEVLRTLAITPAPLAPDEVRGLINLRGQIVEALDLRRILGLPPAPASEAVSVVLSTDEGRVSLLVDRIGEVLDAPADAFEPPPETLRAELRPFILGVYKLEGRLLLSLDTARVLSGGAS